VADRAFFYPKNLENIDITWYNFDMYGLDASFLLPLCAGSLVIAAATLMYAFKQRDLAQKLTQELEEKNAELEELAITDSLTGLSNRRKLNEKLSDEKDRIERGQSTGGIILMIDLDKFKTINDTYGHAAGDEAIKAVARKLSEISGRRGTDLVALLGGDEFTILLESTTIPEARNHISVIENALIDLEFEYESQTLMVSGSVGFAAIDPKLSVVENMDRADKTLYAVKEAKKNPEYTHTTSFQPPSANFPSRTAPA